MKPIVISTGDPSGIGIEIIIKIWNERSKHSIPPFFVLADGDIFAKRSKTINLPLPLKIFSNQEYCKKDFSQNICDIFQQKLPILQIENKQIDAVGNVLPENAKGTIESISKSVECLINNKACALVTAPIAKQSLYAAGFSFPGHTEYLAHLGTKYLGKNYHPVMMLANEHIRTIPVTIHIPLNEVTTHLTTELIVKTARIAHKDLRENFLIENPRLAITGVNPHAGEKGTIGKEDLEIIAPAVKLLQKENIQATGPYPADSLFHKKARENYDVALCMYHDQALIPAKTLGFETSVNVTLGLPFIRTSPDHGTAFDIAGKNIACPESFIAALKLAAKIAKKKREHRGQYD